MYLFFLFISVMAKLNFQQSLSSVSHDSSEIILCWFGAKWTFLIIIHFQDSL